MNPFQPQPAGLPSGSFGARRGAATRARPLHRLLAAPQRLAFAAGGALLLAAALWWALAQLASALGRPWPWLLDPALAQAWLLGVAVWPLFLVGLLCDALPRWLGGPPLPARVLLAPLALVVGGAAAVALGVHLGATLAALGLALLAVGLALLAGLLGLAVLEHRAAPGRAQALPALLGLMVLALAAWAGAVALALGQALVLRLALQVALWLGLVPLAVALGRPDGGLAPSGTRPGVLQRLAWVWLGTAAGLTLLQPDLAAQPALLMGCLAALVMGRVTMVALGQAGRRPRIDNAVWFSAWAAQAAVLAALLAPAQAGGGLALLAAQFWLGAVGHWVWHLRPSLLRLPPQRPLT